MEHVLNIRSMRIQLFSYAGWFHKYKMVLGEEITHGIFFSHKNNIKIINPISEY